MDMEKVIKGINCHIKKDCRGNACPYADVYACEFVLLNDALELIKEQYEQIAMMKMIYGDQGKIVGELVRCKDCKHYTGGLDGYCEKWFRKTGGNMFFCADGEKES